ncbi:DNA-binding protein [Micromonospora polyrhachis]|uniref:Transcriptional regulator with XRE-family HTH domain n=1 Tax=Micromonospora polyrhachis TaxID=1282883 RepID=A0A7W7SVJ3_9ACTN|nr:DNA-binding protein [Micromonospora polyrhachis]MBB4961731.1 transcriptional regulator with XRE-family HTH domain [Micromonospora polyrhachis]
MRAALSARHMGRVIRVYRHHSHHGARPLAQDVVAGWMGQTQAQLSRLENGPPLRNIERLIAWAVLLGIPEDLLWFSLPPAEPAASTSSNHANSPDFDLDFLRSLRRADRRVGGGHLYAAISAYLAKSLRAESQNDAFSPTALAARASLNEMAGWMAHDTGSAIAAHKHLLTASELAERSADSQLAAQIYAGRSHLASHHGNANEALTYAFQGLEILKDGPVYGPLKARLMAMQARGLASSGRHVEATQTLSRAEQSFSIGLDRASTWLSPFDEISFAIESARCFQRIGDLTETHQRLQIVVDAESQERVRSQALARLMLVTTLLGRDHLDEACGITREVLDRTADLGSAVFAAQLAHVSILMRPHASRHAEVPALIIRIDDAVRQRNWINIVNNVSI